MDIKEMTPEKVQDKDIINKVPGFEATKKVADEKITDVKTDLSEKVQVPREKAEEKVEDQTKR